MKAAILMAGITTLAGGALSAGAASAEEGSSAFPRMAPPIVRETAPPLAVYTDEVLFGSVWARPELGPRDRSLVTVAALVAGAHANQTRGHTGRGLDNGIAPAEFGEILAHLTTVTGRENSLAVIEAMRAVFRERGIDDAVLDAAMASAPAAGTDPWTRPGLSPRDRSLVTVAALIATTRAEELEGQLARAMDEGLTPTEASEVVTHLAFYTGWPNAMTAVPVLQRELDRRGGGDSGEAAPN